MALGQAIPEALRSLAFGSISGTYAAVGSAFTHPIQILLITNNTNGDMLFTLDGSTDMFFVGQQSYQLFDFTSNEGMAVPIGTIVKVKQSTAASSGAVWVTAIYKKGA